MSTFNLRNFHPHHNHYKLLLLILTSSFLLNNKYCFCSNNQRLSSRTIKTKYGTLRGIIINPSSSPSSASTSDRTYLQPVEAFLGIPYASPPIGKLRFMPPVTPAIWSDIKIANHFGPVCPQRLPNNLRNETLALQSMTKGRLKLLRKWNEMLKNQSEDCLYLNIYTPFGANNPKGSLNRYPVLVFIHGESYDWNAGSVYDGSILASYSNIVVVTINFRLGVLGFFPSLGGTARGNFGLMDQVAALHWIQENIREFNGDERNVTLLGYGHGAACINFLMLSPMARGLFHRSIMISGSALSPWAIASDAIFHARNFAKILGCLENPRMEKMVLECLRHKTIEDILSIDLKIPTHLTAFGPIIDGIVIPNDPQSLMSKSNPLFGSYELLFGVVKTESYNLFSNYDEQYGLDLSRRDRLLRTLIRNLFNYHLQEIFLTIINEYTDWNRPFLHPISLFDSMIDIFSDSLIIAPTIRTGIFHSKQSQSQHRTYFFTFLHQTDIGTDYPTRLGCIHGQDMAYLFGAPLVSNGQQQFSWFSKNYSRSEINLSKIYINYLTNFIKTGDPNQNGTKIINDNDHDHHSNSSKHLESWPLYDEIQQRYISFDNNKITIQDHYQAHRLSYWFNLLPQLHRPGDSDLKAHHLLESHNNIQTYDGIIRYGTLSAPVSFNTYFQSEDLHPEQNHSSSTNFQIFRQQNPPPTENNNNNIDSQELFSTNNLKNILNDSQNLNLNPGQESSALDLLNSGNSGGNASFSMIVQSNNLYTWLSLIIAIGCSLLILNVLVFAGFYYHKDRNRLETKLNRHKQEPSTLNKQLNTSSSSSKAFQINNNNPNYNSNNNIPLYRINSITDDYNKQAT
ncbi:postsynaptic membrane assembly [Dermatophagoides pteronyssinus]|uniref:acetylcholinesterase n=1 Tax=Dermatophagoides pteronyssinus TaxID=6956 RepID=A0ABQ8J1J8_DERPT|nr:postsynaptic membrane assembly [Dermatophagoides pteronyssinus]